MYISVVANIVMNTYQGVQTFYNFLLAIYHTRGKNIARNTYRCVSIASIESQSL